MKVPFPANTYCTTFPATTTTAAAAPYEPKSVLELRRSPSPPAENPVFSDDPLKLEPVDDDDHVLIDQHLVDWDSLMPDLALYDDSAKPQFIHHNHLDTQINPTQCSSLPHEFTPVINSFDSNQFVPADFGINLADIINSSSSPLEGGLSGQLNTGASNAEFEYVDELIRFAECFETNSLQLAHVILARLNQRLISPTGKPLQRAAFYFKEALQSLLTGSTQPAPTSSPYIIQIIKALKTFSSISPIPLFSSFTANQAVLEALDGSMNVHVIDFDIGLGGQWASFMKELADKAGPRKLAAPLPVVVRVSAIVSEEYTKESKLIRENLLEFAQELNISFEINFISIRTFQYLSFKSIKFTGDEKLAVILSPATFSHVGTGFLNDLRRVSPRVVVHVDAEGQMDLGTTSYRQAVVDGLEFYSTLLASLEAANCNDGGGGGGGDWMRRIETFVVFPKIVEAARRRGAAAWRETLVAAGLRAVGLSQFSEFQAECLLKRVQVRGFHVVKRQAEMLLCWHDRPIVSTSAWKF